MAGYGYPGYGYPPSPGAYGPAPGAAPVMQPSMPPGMPPGGFSYHWPYNPNATVVDMLPPEMLPLVPDHWYNYPPMNPLWHNIIGCAMLVLGIVSICGNALVIYLMSTAKSLRSPTNLLVMNLAFSDMCMFLTNMPIMVTNCFAETWTFGPFMCEFYAMAGGITGNASILTLVFISRDRYNVIVKGIAGKRLTYKKAVAQIIFIWLYSAFWTVAPLFGWGRYVAEGNMTGCTIDYFDKRIENASYVVAYAVFAYYIPLFVMIYSYFFIVSSVASHEKVLRKQAKKMNVASLRANEDQNKQSAELRLAKVAMFTVFLWFAAWTPYMVIAFVGIFTDGRRLTPLATTWGAVFAKSASSYNPIVYALSHPRYKAVLYKKFPSLACATPIDTDTDSKSMVTTSASMSAISVDKSIDLKDKEAEA